MDGFVFLAMAANEPVLRRADQVTEVKTPIGTGARLGSSRILFLQLKQHLLRRTNQYGSLHPPGTRLSGSSILSPNLATLPEVVQSTPHVKLKLKLWGQPA